LEAHSETRGQSQPPVCAAVVASHLFLDGAATPPISGEQLASLTLIENFYDPAYFAAFTKYARS
jgi:hypothetical protein